MKSASFCGRSVASSSSPRRLGGDQALGVHRAKLLQPEPDEPRRLRALARLAHRRGDRGRGLHLPVAEIDQRRDGLRCRLRRDLVAKLRLQADDAHVDAGDARRLVFQLRGDARRDLRPDARRARDHRLVLQRDGRGELRGVERAEHGKRDARADALHGEEQAEPFALHFRHEADQADLVLADLRLDEEPRRLAALRQRLQASSPSNARDSRRRCTSRITQSSPKESTTPVSLPIMDACPAR